jgi:Family of unknown function (DUF6526)
MAENVPQTFANHARLDPIFHFFALPVLGLNIIASIVHAVMRPNFFSIWLIVVSLALVVIALKARLYALKVQDRLIRLEERLRLASLLNQPLRSRIPELTEGQLVALRFASDAECPALAEKALAQNLSRADIKKAVQVWRADYWRV